MPRTFHALNLRPVCLALLAVLVTVAAPVLARQPAGELILEPRSFPGPMAPPLPDPLIYPVQLVIDDDSAEGTFGILGGTARQFLWFNSFPNPGDFRLEQIWVLFPGGTDIQVGDAVQLAVYLDPDQDPTTGAQLIGTYDEVVQVTDGATFSVYPLNPPLDIVDAGDILIGAVNRYYMTGVDPPTTEPAAVDTTASQGQSYFALWSGDAPAQPDLASATTIDVLAGPFAGNHMIRGFGGSIPAASIPSLDDLGLALLIAVLGLAGLAVLARTRAR